MWEINTYFLKATVSDWLVIQQNWWGTFTYTSTGCIIWPNDITIIKEKHAKMIHPVEYHSTFWLTDTALQEAEFWLKGVVALELCCWKSAMKRALVTCSTCASLGVCCYPQPKEAQPVSEQSRRLWSSLLEWLRLSQSCTIVWNSCFPILSPSSLHRYQIYIMI